MTITFNEVVANKDRLASELISSLPADIITEATINGSYSYDVMLSINGHLVEPTIFNELMLYIEAEANLLVKEKLDSAMRKANRLVEAVQEATEQIADEFELKTYLSDEDDD